MIHDTLVVISGKTYWMIIRLGLIALCFLLSVQSNLHAQKVYNLDDCIEYGLQNAWDVKSGELDLSDAKEQIREFTAIGLPQIQATATYQRFLELPTSIIPAGSFGPDNPEDDLAVQFGVKNNLTAGIELNTMLFDWTFFLGLKAIRRYLDLTEKEVILTKYELKYAIKEAYFAVLAAKASKDVLTSNIKNLETSLEETRAFYENGFLEKLDVDRLELSLNNLRTDLDNQNKLIELSTNALKFQINYPLDEDIELSGTLNDFLDGETQALDLQNIETNPENRPEYKVLEAGLILQEMEITQQKYRRYPKLFGFGSYNQQLQGDKISESDWFPNSLVGLNFSVPLFTSLDIPAKINRAKIKRDRAQLQLSQFESAQNLEVRNATINMQQARDNLRDRQSSMDLAEEIYEISQIKFNEGVGSSVELSQAERDYYAAQGHFIRAEYDLIVAQMNLDKALGIQ